MVVVNWKIYVLYLKEIKIYKSGSQKFLRKAFFILHSTFSERNSEIKKQNIFSQNAFLNCF